MDIKVKKLKDIFLSIYLTWNGFEAECVVLWDFRLWARLNVWPQSVQMNDLVFVSTRLFDFKENWLNKEPKSCVLEVEVGLMGVGNNWKLWWLGSDLFSDEEEEIYNERGAELCDGGGWWLLSLCSVCCIVK